MARAWVVVARREFLERVRTKWFIAVTVLGPVVMIATGVLPAWLSKRAAQEIAVIEAVDRSGRGLTSALEAAAPLFGARLQLRDVPTTTDEARLLDRIRSRRIQGYLVIPEDVLDSGQVRYRGDNATSLQFQVQLGQVLNAAVMGERARRAGLDPLQVVSLLRPVDLDAKHTTGAGEAKSASASLIVGIGVMLVLYMAILLYAVNVMRSVVQEKTSRVIELVVSATRPGPLMFGKVIGVGVVGLLQLSIWAAAAIALVHFRGGLLAMLGVSGAGLPLIDISAGDIAVILSYFVLGYFFYSALYAALGAMVNSEQEAQQVQMPVLLLLVLPVTLSQMVATDPRGLAAAILTTLPFSSPVLMPMRWTLDSATVPEVLVSLGILCLSTAGVVYVAARIYRVGILMYGKRPSLREMVRWLRHG
jgi:ABC-2 type transport system permease protein